MRTRDDQIVVREIELLDRARHQRQIAVIAAARERQALNEGSGDGFAVQRSTVFEKIHEAEKIRVGKAFDNLLEYLLGAARCDQPVVHDRNSHDLPILVNASWA